MDIFATLVNGLEEFAVEELRRIIGCKVVEEPGRVFFRANPDQSYRLYARARCLKRIHVELADGRAASLDDIYDLARRAPVEEYLRADTSLAVRASRSGNHPFDSVQVAERIGTAILDRFQNQRGLRPEVDLKHPNVVIRGYVSDARLLLGIDLGHTPLDKRRDRSHAHPAPLNASVAHAMLRAANWDGGFLVDPMCGSGTIPLEAASMVRNRTGRGVPPRGLPHLRFFNRSTYEFHRRSHHPDDGGRPGLLGLGGDLRRTFVNLARHHAEASRFGDDFLFLQRKLSKLPLPDQTSHVVTNPPFGIRGDPPRLMRQAYESFWSWIEAGSSLRVVVLCGNPVWHEFAPLEPNQQRSLKLGSLACSILTYELS